MVVSVFGDSPEESDFTTTVEQEANVQAPAAGEAPWSGDRRSAVWFVDGTGCDRAHFLSGRGYVMVPKPGHG